MYLYILTVSGSSLVMIRLDGNDGLFNDQEGFL